MQIRNAAARTTEKERFNENANFHFIIKMSRKASKLKPLIKGPVYVQRRSCFSEALPQREERTHIGTESKVHPMSTPILKNRGSGGSASICTKGGAQVTHSSCSKSIVRSW